MLMQENKTRNSQSYDIWKKEVIFVSCVSYHVSTVTSANCQMHSVKMLVFLGYFV